MILLHLLPKIVAMLGCLLLIPAFRSSNLPTGWALAVTSLCLVVPLKLGYLLWLGRREHGRLTLRGIVLNREQTPIRQYLWLLPLLLAWILFVTLGIGASLYRLTPGQFQPWLPHFVPMGVLLPTPALYAVWWKRDLRIAVGTRWAYGALDIVRLLFNYCQVT